MKVFLSIILFIFISNSWANSNEIKDFEINGVSIEDSLLSHMSKEEINYALENPTYYRDQKFVVIFADIPDSTYDRMQVTFKPNDKKYIVQSVEGILDFDRDIESCKKKKDQIIIDLENLLSNFERVDDDSPYGADDTGNSFVYGTWFFTKKNGFVSINCTSMGEEVRNEHGWTDELSVTITTKEMENFLRGNPY